MKDALRQRRRQQLKKAERHARRGGAAPRGASWERLRGVLYEGPSARGWLQLGEALEECPAGPELEAALGYASTHLEGWPDALRITEGRALAWYRRALAGLEEPRFALVRTLRLPRAAMDPPELIYMGQSPQAQQLCGLEWLEDGREAMSFPPLLTPAQSESIIEALRVGGLAGRLRRVVLEHIPLGEGAAVRLLEALRGVTELRLRGCGLRDSAVRLLAGAEWASLEVLEVGSGLGVDVAYAIPSAYTGWMASYIPGQGEILAPLERCSALGLMSWVEAPWRAGLRSLELTDVRALAREPLARLFGEAGVWKKLEELALHRCGLENSDVASLRPAALPGLRRLDVRDNGLTPAGAASLVAAWPGAEVLVARRRREEGG